MTIASRFFERAMKLPPAANREVQVERDLRIPMPDGAVLLADRYLPRGDGRPPLKEAAGDRHDRWTPLCSPSPILAAGLACAGPL